MSVYGTQFCDATVYRGNSAEGIIILGIVHYHLECNHQGVGNRLLTPAEPAVRPANGNASVEHRERLGGLLNFYCRPAA